MRIVMGGATIIELPDDDPRVGEIMRLVFGGAAPQPPRSAPAATPQPEADAEARARFHLLWCDLSPEYRRELALLARGPLPPADLERAMGWTQQQLRSRHNVLARLARRYRLQSPVRPRGYMRRRRRYVVRPEMVPWILALAQEGDAAGR